MAYNPVIVIRPLKYDDIPWATKEKLTEIGPDSEFHEKELAEF